MHTNCREAPLALALAKTMRVCHFTDWRLDDKYVALMLHMQNLRELKFIMSVVDAIHWNVIATLRRSLGLPMYWYMQRLHAIIMKAHQSLEAFFVDVPFGLAEDVVRSMFDDPVWKKLPLLHSLTLRDGFMYLHTPTDVGQLSSLRVSHGL